MHILIFSLYLLITGILFTDKIQYILHACVSLALTGSTGTASEADGISPPAPTILYSNTGFSQAASLGHCKAWH